jgi:TonB family protein
MSRAVLAILALIASVTFFAATSPAQNAEAEGIYQRVKENILNITPADCVRDMTRAIELDRTDPVYFYYRGFCYMLADDDEKAIADFDQTLKLNPAYIDALYGRSHLVEKTDKQKAIADLKRIVAIDPRQTNAYGILAGFYLDLGQYDDAYAMGAKLVEMVRDGGAGLRYQAESLARRGRYEEAIPLYTEAIKRVSWDASTFRGRAEAYRHVGNVAAAEADEKTAKSLAESSGGPGYVSGGGVGPSLTNPTANADEKSQKPTDTAKIEPVQLLRHPKGEYTKEARDAKIQGSVTLKVTFNADGTIGAVVVITELPFGLTAQAVEAARKIEFKPATRDGVPIKQTKIITYSFNLY